MMTRVLIKRISCIIPNLEKDYDPILRNVAVFVNAPSVEQSQTNQIISCETDVEITEVGSSDKNRERERERGLGTQQCTPEQ